MSINPDSNDKITKIQAFKLWCIFFFGFTALGLMIHYGIEILIYKIVRILG